MKTYTQVWPAYLANINKLEHSKERIKHIMEKETPAVVPNFQVETTGTYMNMNNSLS